MMMELKVRLVLTKVQAGKKLGAKNEERESKTARKMAQVKKGREGGEERKETLADKPRDSENLPLGLSCLSARTGI